MRSLGRLELQNCGVVGGSGSGAAGGGYLARLSLARRGDGPGARRTSGAHSASLRASVSAPGRARESTSSRAPRQTYERAGGRDRPQQPHLPRERW
jgi:hypothetical protein